MPYSEFKKNVSETVRISPHKYQGHDLIGIRVWAKNKEGDIIPTKKGISINVDQMPELIRHLEWALQQPCEEIEDGPPSPLLTDEKEQELALYTHKVLLKHGIPVHWDTAERMVLGDPKMRRFSKWQLHYVLATRRDLFKLENNGCFRAIRPK